MNYSKSKLFARKKRAQTLLVALKKLFPRVGMALQYNNNWELLVAVMLSAQCTDKKVNEVTARLFKKYKTLDSYAKEEPSQFEKDIYATGFYHNKAKNIIAAANMIKRQFDGAVPCTMRELLELPGVARKTANVVLGNAYGVVEGIAVDTHVRRFALKFDLTDSSDPKKIEQDLMKLFSKKEWFFLTYRFIEYGRQICHARRHDCAGHPLTLIYPEASHVWPRTK